MGADLSQSFYKLTIDQVLQAVEDSGYEPTGEYLQLNSYENRVFDIYLENSEHIIVKVYRPNRWTYDAIHEEHEFLQDLKESGLTVVAPLKQKNGKTISEHDGMYVSLFPKAIGRMPQEFQLKDFSQIGRKLAHLHNIGAQKPASHRPTLNVESFGWPALENLENWVIPEMWSRYEKAGEEILYFLEDHLDENSFIRIHGDCHRGNILQTDPKEGLKENFFVDFDDFVSGPVVQDFWMLFSGTEEESREELECFLKGYEDLRTFDDRQLKIMPALRGLRIIHYANWIARRWEDPTFPKLFPLYETYNYWAEEVEALEKIAWSLNGDGFLPN